MKWVLVFLLFCANKVISQTTIDEYNYLTKGYEIQINNGLGMKRGYYMHELVNKEIDIEDVIFRGDDSLKHKAETMQATLNVLYRLPTKKVAAYLAVIEYRKSKWYICIPHPSSNEAVLDLYKESLFDWDAKKPYLTKLNTNKLITLCLLMSNGLTW